MHFLVLGINKHLSMLLLREKVSKDLKLKVPTKCIWRYLKTKWDIDAAVYIHIDNIIFVCISLCESLIIRYISGPYRTCKF